MRQSKAVSGPRFHAIAIVSLKKFHHSLSSTRVSGNRIAGKRSSLTDDSGLDERSGQANKAGAQPNVQRLDNGRILVELPGVDDPQRVRDLLQSSEKLEFWKVFPNYKGFEYLDQVNKIVYGVNQLNKLGDEDA